MSPRRLKVGDFEVYALSDGFLAVDGGAMFGTVPKTRWARHFRADTDNRIQIRLNAFLIKTAGDLVMVETGVGDKLEGPLAKEYALRREKSVLGSLAGLGFAADDVGLVINTHLHFDHCGGNTVRVQGGVWEPAFPRAKYIVRRGEMDTALDPPDRERLSYLPQTFRPLAAGGRLELVDGDAEVYPGVRVVLTPGHTLYHQSVKVESRGRVLVILGDLVPTSAHVALSYVMSFDLYPLETMASKKRIFEQGLAESWLYGFGHDPLQAFGRVERAGQRYVFRPLTEGPA